MSFHIERSLKAREDLLEIWQGIAIHDRDAANRQLRRIEQAIGALAEFPYVGAQKENLLVGSRTVLKAPHLVFYRVFEAERLVQVLRVLDGRRDLDALFLE